MRTEEPLSQLTHRGKKCNSYFLLPFCCGESPRRLRSVPPTLEPFQSSEVNDPLQRKATVSKHGRFTLVRFTLFVSKEVWLGGGRCVFDSLSCVSVLVDWNRRVVSPSPSLRLPSDSMPFVCSKSTEVTRRYECPSYLGAVAFTGHWATVPHRQSYAVA